MFGMYYSKSIEETAELTGADIHNGLSEGEARARLIKNGENTIDSAGKKSLLRRFIEQFNDFMIIVLIAAAVISLIVTRASGDKDFSEPIIIMAIVVLNAVLGVIQEARAEKSLDELRKISSPHACVIRGVITAGIPASVVGVVDILTLKTGEVAAADCRIIECAGLKTDESALTGESCAVIKDAETVSDPAAPLSERTNMVYASTGITAGSARAIVTAVGMDTEVGQIAGLIMDTDGEAAPLQKQLSHTGKILGIWALVICAVMFVIGTLKKTPPFEMFMTSVSLAVAAIPEGLPAVVTIMLAIGLEKMARRNAVIRHLPSVETLGSASVICTDKTGTLTRSKMEVGAVSGADRDRIISAMLGCADKNDMDPTERAIFEYAEGQGIKPRIKVKQIIPFDSVRKRMTSLAASGGEVKLIIKGAPELLLDICSRSEFSGASAAMDSSARRTIINAADAAARRGMRVIGVCERSVKKAYSDISDIKEADMTFLGFAALRDPIRPEARRAVEECKSAGIRTVMITGDHPLTALSAAEELGIAGGGEKPVTGAELAKMSDSELCRDIEKYSVYARVTPSDKLRIVKAWQKNGAVTAMTGDGVNDAPALKAADIGISLGVAGTDVAKAASDMVLTDDNFATIAEAVRRGRGIFANIRKAVTFLLSSNIGEIITVFVSLLMGCPAPLLPIQLLWVNLVTDSLPAIALGMEPPDDDIMKKPPRRADESIFSHGLGFTIAIEGALIGALALTAFAAGRYMYGVDEGRTMAFGVLSLSQLVHAFNMRSDGSVLRAGIFKNPALIFAFAAGCIMQGSVMLIPSLADMFGAVPLDGEAKMIVALLSIAPFVVVEGEKLLFGRREDTP